MIPCAASQVMLLTSDGRQKIQGEVCLFIPAAATLPCEHVENANSQGTGVTPLVLFLNLYFLYFSLPFPKKLYFYGILFP